MVECQTKILPLSMSKKSLAWCYLLFLGIIWGGSFILMKRGMHALDGSDLFNSTQVAALRMGIAGIILLPITLLNLKKIQNKKTFPVGIFSLFL